MNEVRAYIIDNGWFDERQRNPNLFQSKVDFFIKLCNSFDDNIVEMNESQKKKLRKIAKETEHRSSIEMIIDGNYKDGFVGLLFDVADDLFEGIIGSTPLGLLGKGAIKALRQVIKKHNA